MEGLCITVLKPWKYVIRNIIPKLHPPILGPDKSIIPFKYNKQISGKEYSKLLIKNEEFNNNNTGLYIYNVITEMLDKPMHLSKQVPTTLCKYITTLGFIFD